MAPYTLPLPPSLTGKLKRPARLVIEYGSPEAFNKAVAFYSQLLDEVAAPAVGGVSLPLGKPQKDMELLLLEPTPGGQSANTAVVYWEVHSPKGRERETLRTVHQALASLPGYRSIIAPPAEAAKHARRRDEPASSLLQDDSGNQVGLIVNPNYPRFTSTDSLQLTKLLLLLGGLGAGLLGPFLFRKLFR